MHPHLIYLDDSSRMQVGNKIILAILKSCKRMNALLGSHKWCDFLKNPDEDLIELESRVFYCRYQTDREAQKAGMW